MRATVQSLLVVALALVAWLRPMPARAAAFDFNDESWEGTSELLTLARERLGDDRVEILATVDWDTLTPKDALLVLHPEVTLDYDEVAAFLRAGGRLGVLDDFGTAATLLERFHIQRIRAPLRPELALRDDANLAIAVPAVQLVAGHEQGRHPIVADVEQLVTNHPSALTHPDLTPVLEIKAIDEPDATLAVTGIIANRGRLFAMGDPSAVINLMLRYPGNRKFAEGMVDYLVEDDGERPRQGKLYVVANRFKQRGEYGGGPSLTGELSETLDGLLEALDEMRRTGLPDPVALLLAVLAALGAVVWMGKTAGKTYRRTAPRYATGQPLVAQGGVAGRAAVLSARSTDTALAMLELKSALEEGLAHALGAQRGLSREALVEEINRQDALSRPSSEELRRLLAELGEVESRVASSRGARISSRRLQDTHRKVMQILGEAEERLAR